MSEFKPVYYQGFGFHCGWYLYTNRSFPWLSRPPPIRVIFIHSPPSQSFSGSLLCGNHTFWRVLDICLLMRVSVYQGSKPHFLHLNLNILLTWVFIIYPHCGQVREVFFVRCLLNTKKYGFSWGLCDGSYGQRQILAVISLLMRRSILVLLNSYVYNIRERIVRMVPDNMV